MSNYFPPSMAEYLGHYAIEIVIQTKSLASHGPLACKTHCEEKVPSMTEARIDSDA